MKQLIIKGLCVLLGLSFYSGIGPAIAGLSPDSQIQADLKNLFVQPPAVEGFPYQQLLDEAAARYNLPLPYVIAVVRGESYFDPKAVSAKGAIGLMQMMPSTAAEYGLNSTDLFDPEKNIDAGVHHLADLNAQLEDPYLALGAYYCGQGAIDKENFTMRQDCDDYVHYIHNHLKKVLAGGAERKIGTVGTTQQFSLTRFDNFLDAESFLRLLALKDVNFQLDVFRQEVVHSDHRRMQYQILVVPGQNIAKETICSEIETATGFSFCQ